MKKKISMALVLCLLVSLFSNFAFAASVNSPENTAVLLNGDYNSSATGTVIGSVYSADGNINFSQGISIVEGDVIYNSKKKATIPQYQPITVTGEVKAVDETSFDYDVSDVKYNSGDASIFEKRDYDVKNYLTIASWTTKGGLTINKDTYFKGGLTVYEPLTIDTTKGDVYVKVDSVNMCNDAGKANNGMIKVVGDGKAYILVGGNSWGGEINLFVNTELSYNGGKKEVVYGDSSKVDLYIDSHGQSCGIGNNSEVSADIYTVSANGNGTFSVSGDVFGDIYSNMSSFTLSTAGNAKIVGNVYAVYDGNAKNGQFIISNDVYGNVVTNMPKLVVTGGEAKAVGVVFAPNADASVHASRKHTDDDGEIIGQLVAKTLNIFGSGKILYNKSLVDGFGITTGDVEPTATPTVVPTTEPTVEPTEVPTIVPTTEPDVVPTEVPTVAPTTEPTIIPTAEPTITPTDSPYKNDLIQDNDIPVGPQKRLKSDSAYLYGYTDNWVGADRAITREEVCALVNRLLVQNDARDDYEKPSLSSYADTSKNIWSYSALEYMTYIGVYNSDDGTDEKRNISPSTPVTRGEVAKVVSFSLRLPYEEGDIGFPDITPAHKFYKYVKAMVDAGLWKGSDGMIRPDDFMTRAEFVTMFNRIIGRTEENGYVVTAADCPFEYNDSDGDVFAPEGTKDENGNEIGHWAFYEITRAACSFTKKKVDPDKKLDRSWLDQQ